MNKKLRLWNQHSSWEEAEKAWEEKSREASKLKVLKTPKELPSMVGITPETAKHLKWKSFKWMALKDEGGRIRKYFLKHPFKYAKAFLKSVLKTKAYTRTGDFFLYGLSNLEEFEALLKKTDNLFVIGFSYCHKPYECPSGRFSSECIHDADHPVCRQCFIGKAVHALPENHALPLFIPTVHYIGEQLFSLVDKRPDQQVIFMITACEMTLEMFGDWGNMIGVKGVGVRLDGRICNTMKAFELSENGIKPGLTLVLDETQRVMLDLIRLRRRYG